MASDQADIDWLSNSVDIRLNPRWPLEDFQRLHSLAQMISIERDLRGHIWVSTSGSTAEKLAGIKLVALAKQAFLNSAQAVNAHLQSDEKDIWAQVLPLFHVGGLGLAARAFLSGAKTVQALNDFKWDADYFYQTLQNEGCTLSALVPTQVYDLVQGQLRAPPALRAVVVGGGALSEELYQKARALGWPLLPSFGMTETCSQIATASLGSLRATSFPAVELLGHAQARLSAEGFLEVKADCLLTCYAQWQNGQALAWDPKRGNWLTTEDRAELQGRFLKILGRQQDYIKVGGEIVVLPRLREKLEQMLAKDFATWMTEFVLVDMLSERLGQEIHLVVGEKVPQAVVEQMRKSFDESVLPFERIRQVRIVARIPRSDLGKVLFGELRKEILQRS